MLGYPIVLAMHFEERRPGRLFTTKKTIKDTNEIFQPDDPILCKQTPGNDKIKGNFKPIYRQRVAEVALPKTLD